MRAAGDEGPAPVPEDSCNAMWDANGWEQDEREHLVDNRNAGEVEIADRRTASVEGAEPVARVVGRPDGEKSAPRPGAQRSPAGPMRRLHNVWPSRNIFFCRGLCMTGGTDDCCAPNLCIWTFILVPCTLYFFWVFPSLWKRGAFPLAGATLAVFLVTVGLLLATCCSDPGIIPRRSVILATGTEEALKATLGYDLMGVCGQSGELGIPDELWRMGYRWCRTCQIVRPPRASHCPDCDNCVLRFDHHCPFMNNCIGQRNYHFFFGFLTSVLALSMLVIPSILTFFSSINMEVSLQGMVRLSSTMRILFYGLISVGMLIVLASVMSLGLWLYHVFLITTNKTTKEQQKKLSNITEEPTLCAPRGPQLFDPWAWVDPRDLRATRSAVNAGKVGIDVEV